VWCKYYIEKKLLTSTNFFYRDTTRGRGGGEMKGEGEGEKVKQKCQVGGDEEK
jgi:hypothetical protein